MSVTFIAENEVPVVEEKMWDFHTAINLDILSALTQTIDHLISSGFLPTASRRDSSPKDQVPVTMKKPTLRECFAPFCQNIVKYFPGKETPRTHLDGTAQLQGAPREAGSVPVLGSCGKCLSVLGSVQTTVS